MQRDLDGPYHVSGHLDKAFSECVALSKVTRNSRKGPPPEVPPRTSIIEVNGTFQIQERTVECARLVAEWHLLRGSPIVAACALLAVDDVKVSWVLDDRTVYIRTLTPATSQISRSLLVVHFVCIHGSHISHFSCFHKTSVSRFFIQILKPHYVTDGIIATSHIASIDILFVLKSVYLLPFLLPSLCLISSFSLPWLCKTEIQCVV